ncbi:MAG TPA: response regulator transcription factor [Arachidicoccus soli]|nr:response regulator transcription factor [Arachidicoccus soli]
MANILIADDHPVVLLGIKTYLEQKGHCIVTACNNGIEAYNQILAKQPSIALLDISMPGMTGLEILKKLSEIKTRTKVVLITLQNELSVFNYAKGLGVSGFLLKEFAMNEMEKCLEEVQKGNTYFSPQLEDSLYLNQSTDAVDLSSLTFAEKKILKMIADQKSSKEIAALLFISEKTVETHRSHIMKKLDIPSGKNALLKWAIENAK